jgi:hypothetical protein
LARTSGMRTRAMPTCRTVRGAWLQGRGRPGPGPGGAGAGPGGNFFLPGIRALRYLATAACTAN